MDIVSRSFWTPRPTVFLAPSKRSSSTPYLVLLGLIERSWCCQGLMPYDRASMSLSSPSSPFSPEHSLRESACSSFDDEATEEFPTLCVSSSKELDLCLILSLLAILASKSTSILVQMLRPFFFLFIVDFFLFLFFAF